MNDHHKHHQQRRPNSGKSRPPAPPPPPPRPRTCNAAITPNGRTSCHESQGATTASSQQPQSGVNNRYNNGNTYEVFQIHQPLGIPYTVNSRHG